MCFAPALPPDPSLTLGMTNRLGLGRVRVRLTVGRRSMGELMAPALLPDPSLTLGMTNPLNRHAHFWMISRKRRLMRFSATMMTIVLRVTAPV